MLIYDVILDVGTTGCQQSVSLYQGDDRSKMLRITLLQNGSVYAVASDLNVRLHGVKPDDTAISPSCGVRGGSVYYLPGADVTETQGTVLWQLQIRDHSGSILFTPEFSMEIVASLPIPEFPEGTTEDLEYNAEVLSELSASEDGSTLLFRGEPVGTEAAGRGIDFVRSLPPYVENGTIVYWYDGNGRGLYAYLNDMWVRLTSDVDATMMPHLIASAHSHENAETLNTITAQSVTDWDAAASASHTHANKAALDKLSVFEDMLWYDGKPVGIPVYSNGLPAGNYAGRIVYLSRYDAAGLYMYDGAAWVKMTDNFGISKVDALWEQKHTHENRTTLDKLTESNGKLLFDGDEIGGVHIVATPNALSADAPDGSVAVAVGNGMSDTPVPISAQSGSETVSVSIAGLDLVIGAPTYSIPAINAAIAAGNIGAGGSIEFADGSSIGLSLMPVVADASDNAYTDAGVTLDPDDIIVAQGVRKYAVLADWSEHALDLVNSDAIVQLGAGQIKIPVAAIYAFENLVTEDEQTLSAGWNVLVATLDTSNYDTLQIEIENGVDVNDYLLLPTSDENTMTVGGLCAATFFAGVAASRTAVPKGLYVKLGAWKRLAET